MKNFVSLGIALRPKTLDRVGELAKSRGQARTDFLRLIIERSIADIDRLIDPDVGRLLVLQEHQTLLLDAIARKLIPDQADRLANVAVDNVKRHHGA